MNELIFDTNMHFFSSCFPVNGINRSIIYDVQRFNFEYIPNDLFNIITNSKGESIKDIQNKFQNSNDKETILDYFEYLNKKEYLFFSNLSETYFPSYDISFYKPYNLGTLIIDISHLDRNLLIIIKNQIIDTGVECLIIRFIKSNAETLSELLKNFNDIPTRIIQLFVDESVNINAKNFGSLMKKNNRISCIVKYSSKVVKYKKSNEGFFINIKRNVFTENQVVEDIADFDVNLDLFMESKLYNNYFNKRAYIHLNGDISRWELDKEKFGNIKENNLLEVLNNKKFKKYWNIKKDDIEICSDCEYRYMCVDSRLPLHKNENNLWVLEGECNYNPYTSEWKKI